jgi:hypothetical protein
MPSSYTQTGIELIATGEQSGTWGTTTNTNLQIIDRLTNGVGAISLSGTTHTLTTSDGVLSDGQYAVLVFGGSPSGTNTVTISPNDADHVYIVKNGSGQSVVLTQGSGGNVTVANGKSAIVYADGAGAGAAVVDVSAQFSLTSPTLTGPVVVSGSYSANVVAVSALDIDCSAGNYFTKTINGNSTFTFSNAPASGSYGFTLELELTSGTITWPAAVKFPGNVTPVLSSGKTHLFMFVTDDGGTRWRGAALVDYDT